MEELANDSKLRIGSESKNLEEARELKLVSSAMSKSPTGMPSFKSELMSLRAPVFSLRKLQKVFYNLKKKKTFSIGEAGVVEDGKVFHSGIVRRVTGRFDVAR